MYSNDSLAPPCHFVIGPWNESCSTKMFALFLENEDESRNFFFVPGSNLWLSS